MIMEGFVLRILYRGIRHIKVHLLINPNYSFILNNWNFFWIVQFRLFQNLIICLLVAQKNLLVLDARCPQKMILILLKNKIVLWKNKSFFFQRFLRIRFFDIEVRFFGTAIQKGNYFFLVVCERHLLPQINPSFCFFLVFILRY